MEQWNNKLFLLLNAPVSLDPHAVIVATFFAEYFIWFMPVALIACWLRGSVNSRRTAFRIALTTAVALTVSQVIGLVWLHPRPFTTGIGTNFLLHAPDSSFPSDHLTFWWTVSFSLFMHHRPVSIASMRLGIALAILGLPIAWARIYAGVHFPLDMVGALFVAALSVSGIAFSEGRLFDTLFRASVVIYRSICAPLIRLGWVLR